MKKEKDMKKMFAVGAAVALMLAASSPAMAQVTSEVEGDDNDTFTAQFVDASQFQFALQAQFGDATADADDDSTAEATVDVSQDITQNQANAGLGEISDANQGNDNGGDFFFVD
jgi:hypothetical protein